MDHLQHQLISQYISDKWWRLSLYYWIYLFVYLVFMVMLTTFAVYTPRPGPEDNNCELYKILPICSQTDTHDSQANHALANFGQI